MNTGSSPEAVVRVPSAYSAAIFTARATAWEDSIAGMIPSVRHSSRKASIASVSVTGRYSARPVWAR